MLVFETGDGIIAVGAYEVGDLTSGGVVVPNAYVDVVAVRHEYRLGRRTA